MKFGKAARQHSKRTRRTGTPELRVRIVEVNQVVVFVKLHPERYRHTITTAVALGNLKVDGGDVAPAVDVAAGRGELLHLSNLARAAARIVDPAVRWLVPNAGYRQVSRLPEGEDETSRQVDVVVIEEEGAGT